MFFASDERASTLSGIPSDAADRVITEARKEGVFAGLTSGLASAIIGSRLFGFKRNISVFCGVLAGGLSGYLFTQAFRDTAIAKLQSEVRARELDPSSRQPDSE
ncbi:hypothetical protein CPB83DRAFT_369685 [Crepidotus variabilis]|uniref:Uncharacterized protein n=1 Tax=Crepidotus variabilis TaxID=179855 RepID=A0A9P6EFE5_9AGAR|nr:hypothetical protein CPB83DRAFT_369685 [Crepidotus variabilis]